MLIDFGSSVALNVTRIISVCITEKKEKEVIKKGGFFTPNITREVTEYAVELVYINLDGKEAKFTLRHPGDDGLNRCFKTKETLLRQVKELELENMTQTLENAIRNNGNG